MKALTQKLGSGEMKVVEITPPQVSPGTVLLRNRYSLISAGTEGGTVKTARKGLIGKAKERPQQVRQVIDTIKAQGPIQAYRAVRKRLDSYSTLGYSCCGELVDVGSGVNGYERGDYVACGGLTASHSEIVCVPANLCVKLHPGTDLRQAAYNTLGAIALQGVRQADLRLGETCAVIGLGLLGQLTALLLKASGVRVMGFDINPWMVEIGMKHCLDLGLAMDCAAIEERAIEFSGGLGCDAVIIAAASDSLDPINFAGAIARKRGTIVVVGAVPTGFDREPHFYKKELQLRMSCSYGPGRYDPLYEERGIDYPAAYVRWTEKRNMEAFQQLLYTKKLDVSYLTTHTFKLEEAPKAYDMMMAKSEPFIGILIEYEAAGDVEKDRGRIMLGSPASKLESSTPTVSIGFVGAGSYAQSYLLPNIPSNESVSLKGVLTSTGTGSRSVGERFGFEFCTADEEDIFANDKINTVFIATRHDSHAGYVLKALEARKHVFVEKPLCLAPQELDEIEQLLTGRASAKGGEPGTHNPKSILMVGYNRRFSPLAGMVKAELGNGPMAMTYRVNAGKIPSDSWIQDLEFGGGRIIGEVCHFVDFLTFMNGSMPVRIFASAMDDPNHLNDTVNVSLRYENGSIGTICYFANGDKRLAKERIEVFAHGCAAVLDDFKTVTIVRGGKKKEKKLLSQDKGQKNEVQRFLDAVLHGKDSPIPFDEIFTTSLVTFKILESIHTGESKRI